MNKFSINIVLCREDPNVVYLLRDNGSVAYQTKYSGPHPKSHPEFSSYSAFSPNGTVEVCNKIQLFLLKVTFSLDTFARLFG